MVHLKVAFSFISFEQAEISLKPEFANDTFEDPKAKAKAAWNKQLNRVIAEGGIVDQTRTYILFICITAALNPERRNIG